MAPLLLFAAHWALVGEAFAGDSILKVRASVPGAEVYVDGKLVGTVPLTSYVPVGVHTIRVVADDYDPFVRRLDVPADKTVDVNATLQVGGGTVEFDGPGGSKLTVDGRERGVLPLRLSDLPPGTHSWKVEAPKCEPSTGKLQVEAGRNYLLTIELSASRGIFEATSDPPGAEVWLDGRMAGMTPLKLEGIEPAVHGVELRLADHGRVYRKVDTTDGSRGMVEASLPESGTRLVISTGSDDARVFVNEVPAGQGSRVDLPEVAKGRALVRVERDGTAATLATTLSGSGTTSLVWRGDKLEKKPPLYQRWGFWAAIGGGAAVIAGGSAATAAALEPPPPPTGETTATLP